MHSAVQEDANKNRINLLKTWQYILFTKINCVTLRLRRKIFARSSPNIWLALTYETSGIIWSANASFFLSRPDFINEKRIDKDRMPQMLMFSKWRRVKVKDRASCTMPGLSDRCGKMEYRAPRNEPASSRTNKTGRSWECWSIWRNSLMRTRQIWKHSDAKGWKTAGLCS